MVAQSDEQRPTERPPWWILLYTGIVLLALTAALVVMMYRLEQWEGQKSLPLYLVLLLLLIAGAIGGCLCNIVRIDDYKHGEPWCSIESFFLRPLTGAVCGIVVNLLLLGGAFILAPVEATFDSLVKLMPFVAFAILAGFSSQQVLEKVKELANTLFARSETGDRH